MFKVAGRVLDFYDDPNFIAHAVTRDLDLVPLEKVSSLTDRDFAVKIATANGDVRRWPVYNKTATALSGRYFCEVADQLPENLRNAAGWFLKRAHLRHDLNLPYGLAGVFPRPASGLVSVEEEPEIQPIDPNFLAKSAQDDFLSAMGSMDPAMRHERANKLFKIAASTGVELDPRIWDYVEKEKHGPHLRQELRDRHTLVKEGSNQHLAESFLGIMHQAIQNGPAAILTALGNFDKMAGLDDRYDDGLRDPFLAVFGGLSMEKIGGKAEDIRKWKLNTLATKGRELSKLFDPLFVSKFCNDPEKTLAEAGTVEKRMLNHMLNRIPNTGIGSVKRELLEPQSLSSKSNIRLSSALKDVDRDLAGTNQHY
jgi:hypothetical protein